MTILLFCIVSAFIARYFNKRSSLLFVVHTAFFFMVVPLFFFASDSAFIVEIMQRLCGIANYKAIKAAVTVPCIWLYSTNIAIYIVEIVMLIVVLIGAAIHVTRKLFSLVGDDIFSRKKHDRSIVRLVSVSFLYCFNRIFLKFGRLLN